MNLRKKQLINLPVYSRSGDKLGHLVDFELNAEEQRISKYYVRGENIIKELIEDDLIIDQSQVISIDLKKMVVEDLTEKSEAEIEKKATAVPAA